ncbi:MAG: NAD-dependent epimerase/dehydratase family protein, partial [Elusimicrobia bacterium]|nr:NAD-dependent epimerase/dehydratase family protein [Elusimicrobiota bacterium]
MRILVTGAGGFLAGPLLERLKGRAGVFHLARTPAPGRIACDLADPAAAREAVRRVRPDLVYHLAGARVSDWEGLWRSHVTATVNLLEALASSGRPARVVVAASSAEYGAAGGARRAREDAPLEPVTLYGSCKLSQTMAALSFNRGRLEVLAARLFNVLGPGTPDSLAPGAFARQIARVAAGRQPPEIAVGDLSPRRDYVDARDAAAALEIVARRGRAGECYNVGSGRSVPMSAVLRGLADAAG